MLSDDDGAESDNNLNETFSFKHFPTITSPATLRKRENVGSKPRIHSQWPDFGRCLCNRTVNLRRC
jgi:hypothetical protein